MRTLMSEPIVDPSDCPDCKAAADRVHHGFQAKCLGCRARGAARSPHYRRVRESGVQDRPYRALLQQFELTHEQVRAAAVADFMLRSYAKAGGQAVGTNRADAGAKCQEGEIPGEFQL